MLNFRTSLVALVLLGAHGFSKQPAAQANWRVDDQFILRWGEQPYGPIGLRLAPDEDRLKALEKSTIRDVLLQMPLNGRLWEETFRRMEAIQARYLVEINSTPTPVEAVTVDPAGYRDTVNGPKDLETTLPGASQVLVVVSEKQSQEVVQFQLVDTPGGKLKIHLNAIDGIDQWVTLYPIGQTLEVPDLWDGFDRHRDRLLSVFAQGKAGAGLRGILNPLGSLASLPSKDVRSIPTSSLFRQEFAETLEQKYKSVDVCMKAWSLQATSFNSFDELATLVPLWSGTRGIGAFWDRSRNDRVLCDGRKSQYWNDFHSVINSSYLRRYTRLVQALRNATHVPILQDWAGYSNTYESGNALDGIGVQFSAGGLQENLDSVCPAMSTAFRQGRSFWPIVTNLQVKDARELRAAVQDTAQVGFRGWFVDGSDLSLWNEVASLSQQGPSPTAPLPTPLFFPLGATNPAHCALLPGNRVWLPSPQAGSRLQLGPDFSGYNLGTTLVLWGNKGIQRTLLLTSDNETGTPSLTPIDGTNPQPKKIKEGWEVTLSDLPTIIEGLKGSVVPKTAVERLKKEAAQIYAKGEKAKIDLFVEGQAFQTAVGSLGRDPSSAYWQMELQYQRICSKAGESIWLEAELSKSHTFSESVGANGCSNGAMLASWMETSFGPKQMQADFTVPVRTEEAQTVWVAAKIPKGFHDRVTLQIGRQLLTLEPNPTGSYGLGFDWYRAGEVRLIGSTVKMKLQVKPVEGVLIGIDSILFTPMPFIPNGLNRPAPMQFR